MKKLTLAAALLLSITVANAQDNKPSLPDFMPQIYKSEWATLTGLIKAEKWEDADKLTSSYYNRVKNDEFRKDDAAILRYMILNVTAAELANGKIDNATAVKKLKPLEGKRFISPTITFKSKGILNLLLLSADGKSWVKCTTNKDADVIQMTELFEIAYPEMLQDTDKYDNRNFRLSGIIKTINADSPAKPHLDVTYSGTEIWDLSPAR
ncbi:hypothetical protein [Flavobacterium psychrotrophum]|uniref:hypothetical protein n=1 Tax=Flavobacterium psychrotrophum TaxID=2294119 RepID=UPI000E30D891|nr:hypothetical protein [Flavobacterium psychrotrophum]